MITKIGLVAGDIWSYLEKHNGADNFENVIDGLEKESWIVLMGIGWLAREGHIILEGDQSNCTVRLSEKVRGED